MFKALECGITARAISKNLLALDFYNPRDFTSDPYRTVDDRPYGGGPGMVMKVAPLLAAIAAAKAAEPTDGRPPAQVICMSPQGKRVVQADLAHLATAQQDVIFLAGRYEGIDERVYDLAVDQEWSIGDYVLSGGELAVMVVLDAIIRLLPGALGHQDSAGQDSFAKGLLDCPHYTRPERVLGRAVPEVLLSGDHTAISKWRLQQQLGRTWLRRPDLLDQRRLTPQEQGLLKEFIEARGSI